MAVLTAQNIQQNIRLEKILTSVLQLSEPDYDEISRKIMSKCNESWESLQQHVTANGCGMNDILRKLNYFFDDKKSISRQLEDMNKNIKKSTNNKNFDNKLFCLRVLELFFNPVYSLLTQPQRLQFHEQGRKEIQLSRQAHCGYIDCNNPLDYGMLGVERYFCSKYYYFFCISLHIYYNYIYFFISDVLESSTVLNNVT